MRNNSRKNYRRRRRNTRASQIKLVGIVAVIVVIAIIIVISCFNKTKKDSNKAKDTGTATENVTGVTEQVSETEEAKELFAPKESDATAAIGDELESSYAVVIDEQDGTVVAGKNAHEKMYPASMTKVMTVLVAAEQAEKNAIAAAENENTEIDRQAVIENSSTRLLQLQEKPQIIHMCMIAVQQVFFRTVSRCLFAMCLTEPSCHQVENRHISLRFIQQAPWKHLSI